MKIDKLPSCRFCGNYTITECITGLERILDEQDNIIGYKEYYSPVCSKCIKRIDWAYPPKDRLILND